MNRFVATACALAACGLVSSAWAFGPVEGVRAVATPRAGAATGVVARLDAAALEQEAEGLGAIEIDGFPLASGERVTLEVRAFRVTNDSTRFVLGSRDGADVELDFDAGSITLLRGTVAGEAGSGVFMAVSREHGTVGRIDAGGKRYLISSDGGSAVELAPDEVVVFEQSSGGVTGPGCGVDGSGWSGTVSMEVTSERPIRQIELAVETDYELYELFGDVDAEMAYIVQLYGAVSDIYIRDLQATVVLTYVRIWDDADDLFGAPDLNEFRNYWNQNMDEVHRDVAQFCSGNRFASAGGVAYLPGLCNQNAYSWSAYNLGFFANPDVPDVFNRDIAINAHELGHNSGTPHTHDLGIDTCDDEDSQPRRGTIMAYCGQTFTGGEINNDMRFHTLVQGVVRDHMDTLGADCLSYDCNLNGVADSEDIAGGGSVDVNGNGVPDECEDCNGNGELDEVDIAGGFSFDVNENGVPDECEADCNGNGVPDLMDIHGLLSARFVDSFETDEGWIAENLGATSGDWERGVPVDDPEWEFDPESDSDGSGQCYLTSNVAGNSDVDEGAVRLTSPPVDLGDAKSFVGYDYFLRLTNDNGDDRLLVEASENGLAGPWVTVKVHDSNGGLDWRVGVVTHADLVEAGLTPSSTMRLRFTANDGGEQSVVEAGLDRFAVGTFIVPISEDAYGNGVPDECEEDANGNGTSDYNEIQQDMSLDLDRNAKLDAFEDCDGDGVADLTQIEGAFNIWLAGLEQDGLRQYLSVTGTYVSSTAPSGVEGHDVVITEDGRVLVSDGAGDRVVQFTLDGALIGDLVAPGSGGLDVPNGMLVTDDGRLLVASGGTDSVLAFDAGSGSFAGTLVAPGDGGLDGPFGLELSPGGALCVTSDDGRVLSFDVDSGAFDGEVVSAPDNGGLLEPRGLLFLEDGPLLVTSYGTDAVLSYDPVTGVFLGKWNRNGTEEVLTLDQPWDIEVGPDGAVYVSRAHDHEGGGGEPGGGPIEARPFGEPLHLTNARVYAFDARQGNLIRAYVLGVNSGIEHPTGFAFRPGTMSDCNMNLKPDSCDIASGASHDVNGNGVPDECEGLCAGDFNGDGMLNILDFVAFQAAFVGGDGSADANGDGALNILDFVAFQILFVEGCG